jgi:hypothetical protein
LGCDEVDITLGAATARTLAIRTNSSLHLVAVPLGCSSPHKGGDHDSATSGGVAAAGSGPRLPSATVATKDAQDDAGSGGSLCSGHL